MNCFEINNICLVQYLAKLGYNYASERRNEYWYLSPFREESTPSFKVNTEKNIWYDFFLGKGGKCIDFIIMYYNTDIKGAIRIFENQSFSFHQQKKIRNVTETLSERTYQIISEKELTSITLINYLKERKLNIGYCRKYCKELIYKIGNKQYFGVAFKNDSKGYEIRNSYFKGCLIKKDITIISYRSDRIRVFESWSDFIAYLTLYPSNEETSDFLILNSLSLLDRSLEKIFSYKAIELFLDRDKAGKTATTRIMNLYSEKTFDMSGLYADSKDVNEYLKHHNPFAP